MQLLHISFGGPTRRIRDARGRLWRFEDHPRFGPIVVNQRDDPLEHQPSERSPFWSAVTLWEQQGRRLDAEGLCLWDKPAPQRLQHLGGPHYRLVPDTPTFLRLFRMQPRTRR